MRVTTSVSLQRASDSVSTQQLDDLVAEIVVLLESGKVVDLKTIASEYPQHRDQLEQLLPTLEAIVDLGHATSLEENRTSRHELGNQAGAASRALGDFRIVREIGRGGMGVVYEAEQISLGRRVALKVLPFAAMLDRQQLARFKNEARAAATLDHPNIVAIYSVGCERGVHYYAMQLIEGLSLAQVVEQLRAGSKEQVAGSKATKLHASSSQLVGAESAIRNPQSEIDTEPVAQLPTLHAGYPLGGSSLPAFASRDYFRTIAQLGIQAAEALDHAHQNGILHRDIKPANLLVECSGTGVASSIQHRASSIQHLKLWITDFGLARMETDAGITMTGDILGTLRYMSPEQALAQRVVVDHRSDIYSLGVTLYELLTLQAVFTSADRHEILRQIAFTDPHRPRQVNTRTPHDLETIVLKAIEKNPADRYATAQELADDLRRFVNYQTIKARPPSPVVIMRKWVRRHQTMTMTAAVAAVFLLMLGAAMAADRHRRIREANRFVEMSLQIARSALAAGDVNQADQRLSEAQLRIDVERNVDQALAEDVATLLKESKRYAKFEPLLDNALLARSSESRSEMDAAQHALALYGAMKEPRWLDSLRKAELPEAHVSRVANGVYDLLLLKADDLLRYSHEWPDATRQAQLAKQAQQAREYLDKAISFHAPSRGYYWLLANCALAMNDSDEATRLRNTALETSPHHAAELFYVNRDYRWGTMSHNRGHPKYSLEDNLKSHREMLRFDPQYYNGLFFMALVLGEEGRLEESLVAWYGCLALRPDDFSALANRANAHALLGHIDEAISDAGEMIALRPDLAQGWSRRGRYRVRLNEFNHAAKDFAQAIEAAPNDGKYSFLPLQDMLNDLAWLLATAPDDSLRDGKRAVELASKACALTNHKDSMLIDTLAAAFAEMGDFESAVKWAEKAIERTTDDAQRKELEIHLDNFRHATPWRLN